jgi:hypothetical protein
MDIKKILAELHEERRQVNDVILSLERLSQGLQGRKNMPTAASLLGFESGKRSGTASPAPRAKMKVKTKAAGN